MCGRSYARHGTGFGRPAWGWKRRGDFFGLDTENMGPKARVATSLAVLVPVTLSGAFLVAFVPALWWIFATYFWISFPALGLLASGISGLGEGRPLRVAEQERELLEAIAESGEVSAAAAAARTSLTVAEADGKLKELAGNGHLEVRARGAAVFYALWGSDEDGLTS